MRVQSKHKKFLILACVVSTVLIALVVQGMLYGSQNVMTPEDLLGKPKDITITRLKIAGRVVEEGYDYQVEPKIILRFSIVTPGKTHQAIPVIYHELKPDMFSAGRDVLVEGAYVNGIFEATNLLTQCPSKYVPPKPEQ